jgi:hypothetical protein
MPAVSTRSQDDHRTRHRRSCRAKEVNSMQNIQTHRTVEPGSSILASAHVAVPALLALVVALLIFV